MFKGQSNCANRELSAGNALPQKDRRMLAGPPRSSGSRVTVARRSSPHHRCPAPALWPPRDSSNALHGILYKRHLKSIDVRVVCFI